MAEDFRMKARDWLPFMHPRSLKELSGGLNKLVEGRLWLQVLIALALGVGAGIALGPDAALISAERSKSITDWLALPGNVFLAAVQMIVIPLVVASIIRGLAAGENVSQLREIGVVVMLFFVGTTGASIALGIGLSLLIRPGQYLDADAMSAAMGGNQPTALDLETPDATIPQQLVQLVPANPLEAMLQADMLAVVIFSLVVGLALVTMPGPQAKPLLELLGSVQKIAMTIVGWAMRLVPLAVFGLIAQLTARVGLTALAGVGAYVGVVLLGVAILLVVFWVAIGAFTRRSPWSVVSSLREVQLLAFSTSSSAACMPFSIKTAEEKLGVRPSVAQVVIPLGVTINMNGTGLFQGVATIFLAQVFGVDLDAAGILLVVITAVGASIGTPGTPGAGVVILASVLGAAGVPVVGIGLILGVSRIIDMAVTVVNVTGDLAAASFIERFLGRRRPERDEEAVARAHAKRRERSGEDVLLDPPIELRDGLVSDSASNGVVTRVAPPSIRNTAVALRPCVIA